MADELDALPQLDSDDVEDGLGVGGGEREVDADDDGDRDEKTLADGDGDDDGDFDDDDDAETVCVRPNDLDVVVDALHVFVACGLFVDVVVTETLLVEDTEGVHVREFGGDRELDTLKDGLGVDVIEAHAVIDGVVDLEGVTLRDVADALMLPETEKDALIVRVRAGEMDDDVL